MKLQIWGIDEMVRLQGKFTHILSVVEPKFAPYLPDLGVPPERRLVLTCDDVESINPLGPIATNPPSEELVKKALTFTRDLTEEDSLLIHCAHGVSRSTATAFVILCQANPALPEEEVLRTVVNLRAHAWPNALIVAHGDELLKREGRMNKALQDYRSDPNRFMSVKKAESEKLQ